MEQKDIKINARAIIPIYYSSTTNTSKKISYMLQDKLENESFLATVTNIGDLDREEFLEMTGPVVFIMSTYGTGGSPADGEEFMDWIQKLEKNNLFGNIEFSILGLGNRTFEHFCGNSRTLREALVGNGGKELLELVPCDSSSSDNRAIDKFPEWSSNLMNKLKEKYEIREMKVGELLQKYKVITSEEEIDDDLWLEEKGEWEKKLSKEFLAYHKSHSAEIIHIKELRKQNDGRSTLWIRIKKPEGLEITPACNISIYPQNVRKDEQKFKGSIRIEPSKKNGKVAYPPMKLESLWALANFSQLADLNLMKYALTMSEQSEETKSKYSIYLKEPEYLEKNPIRCHTIYDDLKPGFDFMVRLGVNTVRPYTLASWDEEHKYIDLVASIDPFGVTSAYFKSNPLKLQILPTASTFYVPEGRPIVMIANGSGIAPFRSLVRYIKHHQTVLPYMRLYFGIQSKDVDFYFGEEWEELEKEGKIELRIAESRADPKKKVYVQDLIKEDKQFFKKHLFEDNGVVFLCGGGSMAKSVDTELFEAIKLHQKIPFKAFKLSTELIKNKTIVKEVFN